MMKPRMMASCPTLYHNAQGHVLVPVSASMRVNLMGVSEACAPQYVNSAQLHYAADERQPGSISSEKGEMLMSPNSFAPDHANDLARSNVRVLSFPRANPDPQNARD